MNNNVIDLSGLPEIAKQEIRDFFDFLKQKYKSLSNKHTDIDSFCDKFQIDLKDYKFNREELHER